MNSKKNLIALLLVLVAQTAFCQLKTKIRLYADPFNALQEYSAEAKAGAFIQLEQFIDLNKSITFGLGATVVHLDHRDVYNHNVYPALSPENLILVEPNSRYTFLVSSLTVPLEFNYYVRKSFSVYGGFHFNFPIRLDVFGWDNQPNIYEDTGDIYTEEEVKLKNVKPYVNFVLGANKTFFRRLDVGLQFDINQMNMFRDYELTETSEWGKESSEYLFVSLSLRFMLFRLKV